MTLYSTTKAEGELVVRSAIPLPKGPKIVILRPAVRFSLDTFRDLNLFLQTIVGVDDPFVVLPAVQGEHKAYLASHSTYVPSGIIDVENLVRTIAAIPEKLKQNPELHGQAFNLSDANVKLCNAQDDVAKAFGHRLPTFTVADKAWFLLPIIQAVNWLSGGRLNNIVVRNVTVDMLQYPVNAT